MFEMTSKRRERLGWALALGLATSLVGGSAAAAKGAVEADAEEEDARPAKKRRAEPREEAAPPAPVDDGPSDHDRWAGRFGVGWYGLSAIPIAAGTAAAMTADVVNAPVIGARYWWRRDLGFDVGVGFASMGGSVEAKAANSSTSADKSTPLGWMLHAGVPLALGTGKHYAFLVTPELNFGMASRSKKEADDKTTNFTGSRFDIGARAGAEIYFGFIGLPQLALEGSVGAYYTTQSIKAEHDTVSSSSSSSQIATTAFNAPWDIFRGSVAARYYF